MPFDIDLTSIGWVYIVSVYSFYRGHTMSISTVFTNNRTQAVRLPAELRFPDSVKKVEVRAIGQARIIVPADQAWDSFFLAESGVSEDFMAERPSQTQSEREAL